MEGGKLAVAGTLDQLSERAIPHRLIRVAFLKTIELDAAQSTLGMLAGVSAVRPQDGLGNSNWFSLEAEFSGDDAALHALLAELMKQGLPVVHFSEETQNIEEVFMRSTRGIVS